MRFSVTEGKGKKKPCRRGKDKYEREKKREKRWLSCQSKDGFIFGLCVREIFSVIPKCALSHSRLSFVKLWPETLYTYRDTFSTRASRSMSVKVVVVVLLLLLLLLLVVVTYSKFARFYIYRWSF